MKKLIILLLAMSVCTFAFTQNGNENKDDITVYVTKTGKKFHSKNCTYLNGNGIQKKFSEVKNSHTPCSKCNPLGIKTDGSNEKTVSNKTPTVDENKVSTESTSKGQPIYTGPRGGKYHYSKSGKKVYEKKKK